MSAPTKIEKAMKAATAALDAAEAATNAARAALDTAIYNQQIETLRAVARVLKATFPEAVGFSVTPEDDRYYLWDVLDKTGSEIRTHDPEHQEPMRFCARLIAELPVEEDTDWREMLTRHPAGLYGWNPAVWFADLEK